MTPDMWRAGKKRFFFCVTSFWFRLRAFLLAKPLRFDQAFHRLHVMSYRLLSAWILSAPRHWGSRVAAVAAWYQVFAARPSLSRDADRHGRHNVFVASTHLIRALYTILETCVQEPSSEASRSGR